MTNYLRENKARFAHKLLRITCSRSSMLLSFRLLFLCYSGTNALSSNTSSILSFYILHMFFTLSDILIKDVIFP